MTDRKPDIFTIAYLASEFQAAVERKAKADPGMAAAFKKAATPQEIGEMKKIAQTLFENIPYDQGGNDDVVQAPRAALLVQLVDFYAAISLRVMKEDEVSALSSARRAQTGCERSFCRQQGAKSGQAVQAGLAENPLSVTPAKAGA
jgi:hypothetical protein